MHQGRVKALGGGPKEGKTRASTVEVLGYLLKVDRGDGTPLEETIADVLSVLLQSNKDYKRARHSIALINFWLTTQCFATHADAVQLVLFRAGHALYTSHDDEVQ